MFVIGGQYCEREKVSISKMQMRYSRSQRDLPWGTKVPYKSQRCLAAHPKRRNTPDPSFRYSTLSSFLGGEVGLVL
jgi:hypothetical protein